MKRDDELEPELEAFLTSRPIVRRAPRAVRARALMGARRILSGGAPVVALPRLAPAAAAPALRGRRFIRVALAASVVLAAGTVGAVMFVHGRPRVPAAVSPAPDRSALVRDVPTTPAAASAPSAPAAEPTAAAARPRRATGGADPFAAQLELLQRAQSAYTRRDFSSALALLAEHARRFPRGHLAEEREALRVRSLLGAGRRQEARRAAALFARRFPRSVLLPSLEDEERALE